MAYGQKYHLSFTNQINEDYTIYFMRKDYSGGSTALTGYGDTLRIKNNNDDDRFAPILSKEANISINVNQTQDVSITDFLATEDDDWNVTIYNDLAGIEIFNGWLVVEDSSQPLHDRPLQLHLRASDGLPLLKNVPLKMSDGSDFVMLNNITDYIGHILYYINPDAAFRVYFDIFHASMITDDCPLEQTQIDAKTFEKDETTFEDCYTCLEKIMKAFKCRIFYENGLWHVVSLRQYTKDTFNWWQFSVVSDVVTFSASSLSEVNIAPVGKNEPIKFINKDAVIFYKQQIKSVKYTYNYDIPKEIICNQQLRRGTEIPALTDSIQQALTLDCWDHYHSATGAPNASLTAPTEIAYIKREIDVYGYEKDRYIVLPTEGSFVGSTVLQSSRAYVGVGDKIDISMEIKHRNQWAGVHVDIVFYVFLRAEDGLTAYTLDDDGSWNPSALDFTGGLAAIQTSYASGDPEDEWKTISVTSLPVPKNGDIQLILLEYSAAGYPNETWYKNITIDYHPYIRNSFKPVKGDFNIYSQNLKINRTIDENVNISDSPKKIIKGALHVNNLLATPEWFRLGITESLRFTQQMALLKYHFAFVQFQKIEGTLKGLSLLNNNLNIPGGFLPQYSLTDLNSPTLRYILTSLDINYLSGHWHAVLVECQLNGPTTFDTYDFTYLFE